MEYLGTSELCKVIRLEMSDLKIADSIIIAFCTGYLMGCTGDIWDVVIKRQHLDWQIQCSYGDFHRQTQCMPIEKKFYENTATICTMIAMYLDEILVSWEARK